MIFELIYFIDWIFQAIMLCCFLGETRVHRECKKGDVAMLRLYLQSPGVDVNAR